MSRIYESEEEGQVCVLAGDFNLRSGESLSLETEGWRDAWCSLAGADDWTWRRGGSRARYDRVFLHDASVTDTVVCTRILRLPYVWPVLTDHAALNAVLHRPMSAFRVWVDRRPPFVLR